MRNSPERFNSSSPEGAAHDTAAEQVAIHVIKSSRRAKSAEQPRPRVGNDMKEGAVNDNAAEPVFESRRRGSARKKITEKNLQVQEKPKLKLVKEEAPLRENTEEEARKLREEIARVQRSAQEKKKLEDAVAMFEAEKRKHVHLAEIPLGREETPSESTIEDLPLQPEAPPMHESSGSDTVELDPTTKSSFAHEASPEEELVEQLYRIFGDDTESWDRIRKMPAPFFLRQGMSASPAEANLKAYMRDLMNETGLEPKGRLLGFNETIEGFIMRAIEKLYGDNK